MAGNLKGLQMAGDIREIGTTPHLPRPSGASPAKRKPAGSDKTSPLWRFAAEHFLLSRRKKGDILGYVGLDKLHEKLPPLVIRRRKEEVLKELPELTVNNYYIDLYQEHAEIHAGYSQILLPLLNKKFLTPMDIRRILILLLKMRQICDSTYLIDRETNISP